MVWLADSEWTSELKEKCSIGNRLFRRDVESLFPEVLRFIQTKSWLTGYSQDNSTLRRGDDQLMLLWLRVAFRKENHNRDHKRSLPQLFSMEKVLPLSISGMIFKTYLKQKKSEEKYFSKISSVEKWLRMRLKF